MIARMSSQQKECTPIVALVFANLNDVADDQLSQAAVWQFVQPDRLGAFRKHAPSLTLRRRKVVLRLASLSLVPNRHAATLRLAWRGKYIFDVRTI